MSAIASGFADPVFAAQAVFRALMNAMARPGTAVPMSIDAAVGPTALPCTLAALVLTLADHTTPVWCDAPLAAAPEVGRWLAFHTRAPRTDDPAEAALALIAAPTAMPPLESFAQGSDIYPDRSTTLLVAVDALADGPLRLSGPGIAGSRGFGTAPPAVTVAQFTRNRARFPRGVDCVFAAPDRLAALPRSTIVEV